MSALKKATILASVATSPLAKRRMLRDLGVPKSTYYRWLRLQQHHQGLEDRSGVSTPPWNRLRSQEERSILEAAREMPELSSRQLAAWTTDNLGFAVSESTVYRILRRVLESRLGKQGKREFVQVLRLMEDFRREEVHKAVRDALRLGAVSYDAVKHLVLCRIEGRPPRLEMELYPYLPRANVAKTSSRDYMTLLAASRS